MTEAEKADGRMERLRSKLAYRADRTCGRRSAEQIIEMKRSGIEMTVFGINQRFWKYFRMICMKF